MPSWLKLITIRLRIACAMQVRPTAVDSRNFSIIGMLLKIVFSPDNKSAPSETTSLLINWSKVHTQFPCPLAALKASTNPSTLQATRIATSRMSLSLLKEINTATWSSIVTVLTTVPMCSSREKSTYNWSLKASKVRLTSGIIEVLTWRSQQKGQVLSIRWVTKI